MLVESETIKLLLPELILSALAAWLYVGGTFTRSRAWWTLFSLGAYIVAGVALFQQGSSPVLWTSFQLGESLKEYWPLAVDFLGHGARWLALFVGVLFTLIAARLASEELASEFLGTLMLVVVGIMLVASANDLVLMFLGLELISIPTYVLLFLGRKDRASAEATAKYFFLSIFSSAILLYGFSFLYGIGGTTTLTGGSSIAERIASTSVGQASGLASLLPVALVLVFAGLGFKIAAVPFHFYAPDVYQGTTNANAGLLAVAPKIAGIVALVRLVVMTMPTASPFAWQLAAVLAVFTMTIGNVCALWQQNVRRLMAYSSIAHAGYMLIGLAVGLAAGSAEGAVAGIAAMLFYLAVYVVASIGTFAALSYLGSPGREVNDVNELAGLGRTQPWAGAVLALAMFSLAGIPPLVGFWGKFTLFTGAIGLVTGDASTTTRGWFAVLVIVGAINAAVGAAYYLRIVGVMYFRLAGATAPAVPQGGWGAQAAMTICGVLVAALGFMPSRIVSYSEMAAKSTRLGAAESRASVLRQAVSRRPSTDLPGDSTLGAP